MVEGPSLGVTGQGDSGRGWLHPGDSAPIALDTNLLVRLLTGDDPDQARRVADLIDATPSQHSPHPFKLKTEGSRSSPPGLGITG